MMKNPLDILFKQIKKDLHEQALESCRERNLPVHTVYSNPANWTSGKCICIIHITEGEIGIFREYFHRNNARRLLPAPVGTPVDANELVYGDWWLHPRRSGPLVDYQESEAEVKAIIARFNELMDLHLEPLQQ